MMSKCDGSGLRLGLLLAMPLCLVTTSLGLSEMRVWKSKTGSYEVRAELISTDNESVKLRTEDGRELTVELAKLSQADLDYLAAEAEAAAKARADEGEIRRLVVRFYEAVRGDDEQLREFLTAQGKANFDQSSTLAQDIQQPDRGHRPRVSKVAINQEERTAVADYRIRVKGKNSRMQMLLVSSDGQWGVSEITEPDEDGATHTISFDGTQMAATTPNSPGAIPPEAPSGPSARGPQIPRGPASASSAQLSASSIQTRGAAAYTKGFCAKCHAEKGTGTIRGPDLTDDEWLHCDGSQEGIRQVLVSGVSKSELSDSSRPFGMNPATNLVPASELEALAAYVKAMSADTD